MIGNHRGYLYAGRRVGTFTDGGQSIDLVISSFLLSIAAASSFLIGNVMEKTSAAAWKIPWTTITGSNSGPPCIITTWGTAAFEIESFYLNGIKLIVISVKTLYRSNCIIRKELVFLSFSQRRIWMWWRRTKGSYPFELALSKTSFSSTRKELILRTFPAKVNFFGLPHKLRISICKGLEMRMPYCYRFPQWNWTPRQSWNLQP